jgi:hypothetical protein
MHCRRFAINLACGLLVDGDHRDDIALHINPRFESHSYVALNTMVNNRWGNEVAQEQVFNVGQPFTLTILAKDDGYKVRNNSIVNECVSCRSMSMINIFATIHTVLLYPKCEPFIFTDAYNWISLNFNRSCIFTI